MSAESPVQMTYVGGPDSIAVKFGDRWVKADRGETVELSAVNAAALDGNPEWERATAPKSEPKTSKTPAPDGDQQ